MLIDISPAESIKLAVRCWQLYSELIPEDFYEITPDLPAEYADNDLGYFIIENTNSIFRLLTENLLDLEAMAALAWRVLNNYIVNIRNLMPDIEFEQEIAASYPDEWEQIRLVSSQYWSFSNLVL